MNDDEPVRPSDHREPQRDQTRHDEARQHDGQKDEQVITNAIADIKTGIRDARAIVSRDDKGLIEVTVEVFDKKHLDRVLSAIGNVPGVIAVERVNA